MPSLVGGVDPADLPDPHTALAAIEAAGFVVSLELRESAVTALADVVFPIAPVAEKTGSFTNWEGRIRPFEPSLTSNAFSDLRVLQTLADELGADLGFRTAEQARAEIAALGRWDGPPAAAPEVPGGSGAVARQARSGAGGLANAVGPRPVTGRRAVPGGHRAATGGPAVGGDRRRDRRAATATWSASRAAAAR